MPNDIVPLLIIALWLILSAIAATFLVRRTRAQQVRAIHPFGGSSARRPARPPGRCSGTH